MSKHCFTAFAMAATLGFSAAAQAPVTLDQRLLQPLAFRNLGVFWLGARASDIAVPAAPEAAHLYTFYVSFWTGGIWKTTNNGTTFQPVFDTQNNLSIGALAVEPFRTPILSGPAQATHLPRAADSASRSAYFKSTDSGRAPGQHPGWQTPIT